LTSPNGTSGSRLALRVCVGLGVALVGMVSVAAAGCSFAFVNGPPDNHRQRPEFQCTETYAPPVVDTTLAVVGGVMTMGIPLGFGVIVFTIVITAYYVNRANREFDALSDAVAKEVLK